MAAVPRAARDLAMVPLIAPGFDTLGLRSLLAMR
jgi:hypothetical protein